jgi:hypothetical protein
MGLADDLLDIADRLAAPAPTDPEQASLRRAVSTAYYALFHLLVGEVGQLWQGGSADSRQRVERALEHTVMKEVSNAFSQTRWTDWSGQPVAVPPDLHDVARAFVSLQHERHEADYNSGDVGAIGGAVEGSASQACVSAVASGSDAADRSGLSSVVTGW